MSLRLVAVAALLLVPAAAVPIASTAGRAPVAAPGTRAPAPSEVITYARPLAGAWVVVRPFRPPPGPYSAGHRGVDLRASPGTRVLAPAGGRVSFAGAVAGRGVLVLAHPDGISTEYEPVRPLVRAGARVRRGQVVAAISGRHPGCPDGCLHWGAKRAGQYLDPLSLLRALGPVVLLPWPRDGRSGA